MTKEMVKIYRIDSVTPSVYLDNGRAITGHRITATLLAYNEQVIIDVPDLKTSTVDKAIMSHALDRAKLDELGNIEDTSQ